MKTVIGGLLIGLTVGLVDVITFKFILGFPVSNIDAMGAISFWTAAGMLVHTSSIQLHSVFKGLLIGLVMGIPWLIDLLGQGKLDEIIPLAIIFTVFGLLTGFLSGLKDGYRNVVT